MNARRLKTAKATIELREWDAGPILTIDLDGGIVIGINGTSLRNGIPRVWVRSKGDFVANQAPVGQASVGGLNDLSLLDFTHLLAWVLSPEVMVASRKRELQQEIDQRTRKIEILSDEVEALKREMDTLESSDTGR